MNDWVPFICGIGLFLSGLFLGWAFTTAIAQ